MGRALALLLYRFESPCLGSPFSFQRFMIGPSSGHGKTQTVALSHEIKTFVHGPQVLLEPGFSFDAGFLPEVPTLAPSRRLRTVSHTPGTEPEPARGIDSPPCSQPKN